jgi:hypothetical protein
MDLGLDTGLRNLPIVVKRMQRRQWARIVPALLGQGRIESGWGITNLRLATTRFYGRTELGAGPVGRASARRAAIHGSVQGFAWTSAGRGVIHER